MAVVEKLPLRKCAPRWAAAAAAFLSDLVITSISSEGMLCTAQWKYCTSSRVHCVTAVAVVVLHYTPFSLFTWTFFSRTGGDWFSKRWLWLTDWHWLTFEFFIHRFQLLYQHHQRMLLLLLPVTSIALCTSICLRLAVFCFSFSSSSLSSPSTVTLSAHVCTGTAAAATTHLHVYFSLSFPFDCVLFKRWQQHVIPCLPPTNLETCECFQQVQQTGVLAWLRCGVMLLPQLPLVC